MKLTDHDLKQITDTTLEQLASDQLLLLVKILLADHKEARDRLNQNSNNCSRPPSSMPPWVSNDTQNLATADKDNADDDTDSVIKHSDENDDHLSPEDASLDNLPDATSIQPTEVSPTPEIKPDPIKRVAGKQEGTQGYGRTKTLAITEIVYHPKKSSKT
jgi:hypothetical protein